MVNTAADTGAWPRVFTLSMDGAVRLLSDLVSGQQQRPAIGHACARPPPRSCSARLGEGAWLSRTLEAEVPGTGHHARQGFGGVRYRGAC
jgi:hypothetical protein